PPSPFCAIRRRVSGSRACLIRRMLSLWGRNTPPTALSFRCTATTTGSRTMERIVDWAAAHARMVIALILLTLGAGAMAYVSLPKEGEPDIEVPALFVSVPFPGISATDSETLLIRPMERELSDLNGLTRMSATASQNYAGIVLEFEFGW